MVFRIRASASVALLVCSMVAACAWNSAEDAPVAIGAIYNLNGAQMALDIPSSTGARLSVDLANEGGGALDRPVTLRVVDGQSTPRYVAVT